MADPPDQKVLKNISDNDNVDRLSKLPDCILLRILSSFNTKDAAVTSILSKRWRNLFVSLPDVYLQFCVDNRDGSERDRLFSDFINLANRVIRQRNLASIGKIELYMKHFDESYRSAIESLVCASAICSSKVRELDISLLIDDTKRVPISVSPGIFICKTLVSLSLDGLVNWIVPSFVALPNLKRLILERFRLTDESSIPRFLQGCPVLEEFYLFLRPFTHENEDEGIEVKALHISSFSLEILWLNWFEQVKFDFTIVVESKNLKLLNCFLQGQHKVTLDAPNLTSLSIEGYAFEVNIIRNMMSLDNAAVQAKLLRQLTAESALFLRAEHAFEFFSRLQNAKSLDLSDSILMALHYPLIVVGRKLPIFRNLIKLELRRFYCRDFRSKSLSILFERSPNLQVLIFAEVFEKYLVEKEDNPDFPKVLPPAFIVYLKEVKISQFKGEEYEFNLVEYLLYNVKSLKKMTLVRESWNSLSEGCDRILSFKKCSENCQIVFEKKWDWIRSPRSRKALNLSP